MKNCPYAKSDMTPCHKRDGCLALLTDDFNTYLCVGCERRVFPNVQQTIDLRKLYDKEGR